MVWANAAGIAVFFGVAIALAQPYLAVVHDHPEARRTIAELKLFSPSPRGFFAAPADNFIWGGLTSGVRDGLSWPPEQVLFPGLAIVALAAVGAFFAPWPRRARVGLVVAAAAATLLATGVSIADGWLGYRWLYELAPGWDGLRTPGRLNTLGSLALAVLAAGGAQAAIAAAERRRAWAGTALGLVLAAAIVVEGLGPPPINRVPDPPAGLTTVADPQMHLPLGTAGFLYMLWSVDGFPRIANGGSGFVPRQYAELADVVKTFPDRRSVAYLRRLGIESVVVHTSLGAPVPPVARTRALGLRGRLIGGAIVYRIPG
jgi:hypothetical protein